MEEKRDFKGIWIPKDLWLNTELTVHELLLLVEINSLDNQDGCWATNEYFSKFFRLSKSRISKLVNSLKSKGFITVTIRYKKGTKEIEKRIIVFNDRYSWKRVHPMGVSGDTPMGGNGQDNNTVLFNNTLNNSYAHPPEKITHTKTEIDNFNKFISWQRENTPRVLKMKNPFTINQFLSVKKQYSFEQISGVLIAMENKADLHKKYISANLTFRNWVKNEWSINQKSNEQPKPTINHKIQEKLDAIRSENKS